MDYHHPDESMDDHDKAPSRRDENVGNLALLRLPFHSSFSLNSSSPQTLSRHDEPLIVIHHILPSHGFHLLVFRGVDNTAPTSSNNCSDSSSPSPSASVLHTTGIIMLHPRDENWLVMSQYDPRTEEISSQNIDPLTYDNVNRMVMDYTIQQPYSISPHMDSSRVMIPYTSILQNTTFDRDVWHSYLTNFITLRVLKRHDLHGRGDKILPGTYTDEDSILDSANTTSYSNTSPIMDGITLSYEPIPCINLKEERIYSHLGTRKFLSKLSPSDRTALFVNTNNQSSASQNHYQHPSSVALDTVLSIYYHGQWEDLIGEFQLSFVMFLCCGCLSSLEHWRDTLSMLSLVPSESIRKYSKLYLHLLTTMKYQLYSIDDKFKNDDFDIIDNSFLIPTLLRLHSTCSRFDDNHNNQYIDSIDDSTNITEELKANINTFLNELKRLFPYEFEVENSHNSTNDEDDDAISVDFNDENGVDLTMERHNNNDIKNVSFRDRHRFNIDVHDDSHNSDDDDDGPVIVPMEDIEASINRTRITNYSNIQNGGHDQLCTNEWSKECIEKYSCVYPLLFASMTEHEDILMTCARILDEKPDVSLVREAAAYLENVEAKRGSK